VTVKPKSHHSTEHSVALTTSLKSSIALRAKIFLLGSSAPTSMVIRDMKSSDTNFGRVTHEHYITGQAAINFPWAGETTGGWHYLSYWDKGTGKLRISLAGIHYPETIKFLGTEGISDARLELQRRGWPSERDIYMANHFRAAADMAIAWTLGESKHCNVELLDWFPQDKDFRYMVDLLLGALRAMPDLPRERLRCWLELQVSRAQE